MPRDEPQVNFRIPMPLLQWLRSQAASMRRSVTAELVIAIERHKEAEEAKKQEAANATP